MTKTMLLAGVALASTLLVACGEKKAEDAPAAEAPAADAAAPAADAMAPAAAEGEAPSADGSDDRGNDGSRGLTAPATDAPAATADTEAAK